MSILPGLVHKTLETPLMKSYYTIIFEIVSNLISVLLMIYWGKGIANQNLSFIFLTSFKAMTFYLVLAMFLLTQVDMTFAEAFRGGCSIIVGHKNDDCSWSCQRPCFSS